MSSRVSSGSDKEHVLLEESYSADVRRTSFAVPTRSGELSGWVAGTGPRVLALHGGPGLNFDYLDDALAELAGSYRVATYQQRGVAPSTEQGEFTIAEAVSDIVTVLDGLGWDSAYLMGHSWGGHLVFHAAVSIPERWPRCCRWTRSARLATATRRHLVPRCSRGRPRTCVSLPPRGDTRGVLLVLGVVLRRSCCCAAHASHRTIKACKPRAVGGPDGPPARAGVVATGDQDPGRRARWRTEPDATERRRRHRRPDTRRLVPHRAGSRALPWHEAPGCLLAPMNRLVADSQTT